LHRISLDRLHGGANRRRELRQSKRRGEKS
jgi:hypothetical protein